MFLQPVAVPARAGIKRIGNVRLAIKKRIALRYRAGAKNQLCRFVVMEEFPL